MRSNTLRIGGTGAVLALAVVGWLGAAGSAAARVGETQDQIEQRLLEGHTAKVLGDNDPLVYPNGENSDNGRGNGGYGGNGGGGRRGGQGGGGGGGLNGFAFSAIDDVVLEAAGFTIPPPGTPPAQGSDFDHVFYFKTDDDSSASYRLNNRQDLTGWVYEVYFYHGVSVLEIYRRVGLPLQDAEIDQVLALNAEGSTWAHADIKPSSEAEDTGSFLGYQYSRADNKVRGLKVDNDLVLFSAELDQRLIDLQKKADKMQTTGKSAQEASASVKGF